MHITVNQSRKQVCFKLSGSLDLSSRPMLAQTIESIWHRENSLLLDLSEVQEIDLSGLSWLLLADSYMRGRGGRLRIVAASPSVQRAMQLLNPATRTLFRRDRHHLPLRPRRLQRRQPTQA